MPAQTGTTTTPEAFTGYTAACRAADALAAARAAVGTSDTGRIEDLLANADQYLQLAATMAGSAAHHLLQPPRLEDEDRDQRGARR